MKHAKSSAALVSLGIHAALIVVAVSFVAVTVIQKEDNEFEAKPVNRPKMQLKKLQVPVNIKKKKAQKPKLRKRIVVAPKVAQNLPDIKMPEVTGVKGGLGNAGAGGLGGAAELGFTMPEINLFGIKSRGEKVFILLDASHDMMLDEIGGIPAYALIKKEVVKIMEGLPVTALFNVAVYDSNRTYLLFDEMVPASSANTAKVEMWLQPLNSVRPGMGAKEWGPSTLGPGGLQSRDELLTGKFERLESWHRPAMLAMKQNADTIFVLTAWWGFQRIARDDAGRKDAWYQTSTGKRYLEYVEKAKQKLAEDNAARAAQGQPPRAISSNPRAIVVAYYDDIELPPEPEHYYHVPKEYIEGMTEVYNQYRPKSVVPRKSGIQKRQSTKAPPLSFNVIRFTPASVESTEFRDGRSVSNFKKLTSFFRGEYREISGMNAIKSATQE